MDVSEVPGAARNPQFKPGDILYCRLDGSYHFYKVLASEFHIYHVLRYQPVKEIPDRKEQLEVYLYHTPIAMIGFEATVFFAHVPLTWEDLTGYREYLSQTGQHDKLMELLRRYERDEM